MDSKFIHGTGYVYSDRFGVKYFYREDQPGPMPVESEPKITDIENWRDQVKMPYMAWE